MTTLAKDGDIRKTTRIKWEILRFVTSQATELRSKTDPAIAGLNILLFLLYFSAINRAHLEEEAKQLFALAMFGLYGWQCFDQHYRKNVDSPLNCPK